MLFNAPSSQFNRFETTNHSKQHFLFLDTLVYFGIMHTNFMDNKSQPQAELLTIFHFNDVYNIQPYQRQPKGGAAYFHTLLHQQKQLYQYPLTLFSGDAFSPSLLSSEFDGENMVKPMQSFGIDLACIGNHDLDYELPRVKELTESVGFPWLLTNIDNKLTGTRLADGLQSYIIQKNGIKIGFFSLAAEEWLDTLFPFYKEICIYHDFIEVGRKMVKRLRQEDHCDMVIALTHMMKYNDLKLAKEVAGIDLILGGHDHLIVEEQVGDALIVKSGTDFQHFSIIKVQRQHPGEDRKQWELGNKRWRFEVELKEVHHENEKLQPDPILHQYIEQIYQQFKEKKQKVAIYTLKDLDLRFSTIRKEPNAYLEFLVSMYRFETGADIAMMNSGNFRMDTLVKTGPVTFGVIENIIFDTIVVIKVSAPILIKALENCVSMYPNLAGRYSAFSGLGFTWDASKKPGNRVLVDTIRIHESETLDMEKTYLMAVHSFTADGGDGFGCLKGCDRLEMDEKYNHQILHDLLHDNRYLLDQYQKKYPNRFKELDNENHGHKLLQLNLPEPKNVHMILSEGKPYDH